MTDRVDLLEERVDDLTSAVARLEGRLASLESPRGVVAKAGEECEEAAAPGARYDAAPAPAEAVGSQPAALAGRVFLGIGGAFLFRALTEAGTLPHLAGVALGWRTRGPGSSRRKGAEGRDAGRTPPFTGFSLSRCLSRSSGKRRCGCRRCRRSRRPGS
ncbi:MAG: hypothetical protein IPF66_06375 [Holophagales bacterium]|nr:hypothetical protein [Holophagales bacterium]